MINMSVVGFNFTKISAEKTGKLKGDVKISNDVSISKVEEMEVSLGIIKETALKFIFGFTSTYEPEVGKISLSGEVIYTGEQKKIKDIMKEWTKSKKIDRPLMAEIMNNILAKCNIKALIISQDINLPPPIPLPSVKADTPEQKK